MDTRELAVPYGGEEGVSQPVQRTRDILKVLTAKTDQHMAYLLLGIENQSHIHYAMPVRSLLYDALQYTKQVEGAAASHREAGDYKGAGEDEFLSGFMKDDRLLPVVTLVIYFGKECWDGPLSLHEMFTEQIREESAGVMEFVPDYRMNLIAPGLIGDEDFSRFRSTLKEVLAFIKYSGDRERLTELVQADERFRHLGRAEVDVLNACARADIPVQERKEETNVCEAIQEMVDEARQEGREEKEREMCQGLKEMIDEARQEGREEKEKEMCQGLQKMVDEARQEGREEKEREMCQGLKEMIDEARQEGREEKEREMCQGLKEMIDEARQEGREEKEKEIRQGLQKMVDEARQEGRDEAARKTRIENARLFIEKTGWTLEQVADILGLTDSDCVEIRQMDGQAG